MAKPHISWVVGCIVAASLFGGSFGRDVCAQQPKVDKAPRQKFEGVDITANQVKVKEGYRPVKISQSKAAVQRIKGGGPGAIEVDCTCKSAGSCDIEIIGDIIRCQPMGGCTGCDRIISVPGGVRAPIRQ